MTPEELARRRNEYAKLHESSVQRLYRQAWKECSMDGNDIPRPAAIQNLVQVWKTLWRWRRK
jgi:hypothetical protein